MTTLHELIEIQVRSAPGADAVRGAGETLSYGELNRRANQVAHHLRDLGVGPDVPVAVAMERSIEMVVALLGILKAGGAYLPLNPRDPPERLGYVLNQAGVPVVLIRSESAGLVEQLGAPALALDGERDFLGELPAEDPAPRAGSRHLAYVIYTSGSTGKPKGCMIEHRAIRNRIEWMRDHYAVTAADRVLQKTPYTFDVSVWEFFLPLSAGGCLVLAKPGGHQDNAYLRELIQRERVTLCHFVPSMLRFFLREPGVERCASLRHVFVSGEALPFELMREFLQRMSAPLHNLYGPTEAAVDVTHWTCRERPDRKVPIGRAIAGVQCHVLDAERRRVPDGAEGELYLGGIGVGRGYLNQPELTRERFVPDPFASDPTARLYRTGDKARVLPDGEIEFLGRLDFQVKVRGFRIELGEIEETLRAHPAVEDAAVVVANADSADPKLVAYLVVKDRAPSVRDVREFVKTRLPDYMAPNVVTVVDALPTGGHGKLDRSALLAAGGRRAPETMPAAAPAAPEASLVEELRGFFTRMLGVTALGADDDLFDAGATSFTMVQAVAHIQARHGVIVPTEIFLDQPTLGGIARHVAGQIAPAVPQPSAVPAARVETSAEVIELARPEFRATAYAQAAPARDLSDAPVPLVALGRLLAVLRRRDGGDAPAHLYSSAGGLRAIQAYVYARAGGVDGLEPGFHYYHPHEHRLYYAGPATSDPLGSARDEAGALYRQAGFVVFLVVETAAIQPVYRDAAPSLAVVEAGYIGQTLLEQQRDAGVGLVPLLWFDGVAVRTGGALDSSQHVLHALAGGIPAPDGPGGPRGPTTARSADPAGERRGCGARFLRSADDAGEGFPSAEENERLHRAARHLRRFAPDARSVSLAVWEPAVACYRLRAAQRVYRDRAVGRRRFDEFLALFASRTAAGDATRLHASVTGLYPFQLFIYVAPGGVEHLAEGLYRYNPIRHRLSRVAARLSADLKSCCTPFNRRHVQAAKFCGFLVSDAAAAPDGLGGEARYFALLEVGHAGQLLLNRQAEFGLGICPIGGLRFDKIREDFRLRPGDDLLHAFVGGDVDFAEAVPWEPLIGRPAAAGERRIAIVGISGRYPGAPDLDTLAANLRAGRTAFRAERADTLAAYRKTEHGNGHRADGGAARHWGGFLDDVDCFDASLFQITPAEARTMDPQERLFLEVAWECLEHAGYTAMGLSRLAPRVGVFVGAMWDDYQHYDAAAGRTSTATEAISSHTSSIANRASFFFDFKGPSVAVNTSCSSAMTALHQACQSLLARECAAALAGGVNVMSHPFHQRVLAGAEILSPDEASRPFGRDANGWVAGEGVGAVLLKRFDDAVRDGDTIHGMILGTAISHSGRTARYGAPAAEWQRESMQEALRQAGVGAETISYVEAAAPGAGIADAAEAAAIRAVFGGTGAAGASAVRVGSIKASIGHLESASAMSQLAKVLLQLRAREIFPTLGSEPRNPLVDWAGTRLALADRPQPWDVANGTGPRRALINAFGATGSAGHLVLEEHGLAPTAAVGPETDATLIVLSAATAGQLTVVARRLHDWLDATQAAATRLADIGHTLRVGRVPKLERLAFVADSREQLRAKLGGFLRGGEGSEHVFRGRAEAGAAPEAAATLNLVEIARRWVVGEVALPANLSSGGLRRVPLPTYPFAKERHWISFAADAGAPAAGPSQTVPERPGRTRVLDYLRGVFADVTEMPPRQISIGVRFDDFGITSMMIRRINERLKAEFGEVSAALLFEHPTIDALADYLLAAHPAIVARKFGDASIAPHAAIAMRPPAPAVVAMPPSADPRPERIAIIGVSGRYPQAEDVGAFWENLRAGRDCITEVPRARWDSARFASGEDPPSRWGGFLDGVDEFDPFFFRISPKEAEEMDPQERLFLQEVWHLFEDAGYPPAAFGRQLGRKVGVFVGVMYGEYQLFSGWDAATRERVVVDALHGSIANRVSYTFDFQGPSLAVDTLCSSSLTALHLAVQSIRAGDCAAAIVGGVNLSLHPNKYLLHARSAMSSSDGRCRSFGAGGDGFVPGEGVGALLLKPLAAALRDGDQVYGVIGATAVNHDGRTHGYTVPNPNAQAEMIADAIRKAGVEARSISYVEAHGTGTALGDPIELTGLTKAFQLFTAETQFCALGSVKSNIGHLEAAAGVAGLTKILLQLRHGKLAPSLHAREVNPDLHFAPTPFFVQQELADWPRATSMPRRACLSSFGAGGANAHAIIEEFVAPGEPVRPEDVEAGVPRLIVLSAQTPERLAELAGRLAAFVARRPDCRLSDFAYTLQVGREPLEERAAFLAQSWAEVAERLTPIHEGRTEAAGIHRGRVTRAGLRGGLLEDDEFRPVAAAWIEKGKLDRLLEAWVSGLAVEWSPLYGDGRPRRVSLPGYPFARERYWVPALVEKLTRGEATAPHGHPLLHRNTSDLWQRRFTSIFSGDEFFLRDHQLGGERVLPAAACLELVRAAIAEAAGAAVRQIQLRNVGWVRPFAVTAGPRALHVGLEPQPDAAVRFTVYSDDTGETAIVCQGVARYAASQPAPRIELDRWQREVPVASLTPAACYAAFRGFGLVHGPSFQALQEIRAARGTVLARLQLPAMAEAPAEPFGLHPALLDAAFQATLAAGAEESAGAGAIPFALDELHVFAALPAAAWVCIRPSGTGSGKLDLDLCDAAGAVCARITGFASRPIGTARPSECRLFRPAWRRVAALDGPPRAWARHVVLLAGFAPDDLAAMARALPPAECVALPEDASDFAAAARPVFERVQAVLRAMPAGEVLMQVVVRTSEAGWPWRGVAGLLKTARRENPRFHGQLLEIAGDVAAPAGTIAAESRTGGPAQVRYLAGGRFVEDWAAAGSDSAAAPVPPWRRGGVYLITGGAGGLGLIFAAEILRHVEAGVVVLVGRSPLSAEKRRQVQALEAKGKAVTYRQVDVTDRAAVAGLIATISREHGPLSGVLHAAGIVDDGLIYHERAGDFAAVVAPKAGGAITLDAATRHLPLELFAVFSSTASVFGNVGQADYAAANAFLDAFAQWRHEQVAAGRRHGRTLAVNWPLWLEGGMRVEPALAASRLGDAGLEPLATRRGLDGFYRALAADSPQVMVLAGDPARIEAALAILREPMTDGTPERITGAAAATGDLAARMRALLHELVAATIKSPPGRVKDEEPFEAYGIDSVMVMKMTDELEKYFGSLSKTLFFEYQSVAALAGHFLSAHPAAMGRIFPDRDAQALPRQPVPPPARSDVAEPAVAVASPDRTTAPKPEALDIAIIGLAGRYPLADDLEAFWNNLRQGRDCITEIPADRWDWRDYYGSNRAAAGAHQSKWGGFINDVDKFDPLFFNIAPNDAAALDPQERLFLETTWAALEDAGCRPEDLRGGAGRHLPAQVGVYAGVMYSEYQLLAHEQTLAGRPTTAGGIYASIANRVSFFLDLHGPSLTVDTMCSSSLTALHLACEDLHRGVTDLAIAGGVNVTIHPNKYLLLSEGQFISTEGHCGSFGRGGDGYIPGEGVGVAILKRLADAQRDGDPVYGVIKGSAVNHGGKTNGFTVPNPNAQYAVVAAALARAGLPADRVTYVEAHGTGTKLGDPIEIAGLKRAFGARAPAAGPCWLGSVKSNIGHGEAAAGIAGLTKVLLQMKHGGIAPSLHSAELNPHLGLEGTSFVVNQALRPWTPQTRAGAPLPRVAGLSGFGAGGSNAHLVIEEYLAPARVESPLAPGGPPQVFVLSARDEPRLCEVARRLHAFVERTPAARLDDLAWTLQVGRQPLDCRLGFVASARAEVLQRLALTARGESHPALHRGRVDRDLASPSPAGPAHADLDSAGLAALLEKWVIGAEVNWAALHPGPRPRRLRLPTYPFARDRYWLATPRRPMGAAGNGVEVVPPRAAEWLLVNETWAPEPLPADLDWHASARRHAGKQVLVVAATRPEADALAERLRQLESAATLSPGLTVTAVLFAELAEWSFTHAPDAVLILGTGADALPPIFTLSQRLMQDAWSTPIRLLVGHGGAPREPALAWEALGGFLRTAMMEAGQHVWTSVDCREMAEPDGVMHALLREWLAEDESVAAFRAVRYSGAERAVQRRREVGPAVSAQPIFRRGATYLMAGGGGPVGARLCRELAKAYRPRLVILSRGALDAEKEAEGRALAELGADVHHVAVDIGDRAALATALAQVKAKVGPLHGIIHLARLVEDGLILSKSPASLGRVLRAKVHGTLLLDELTAAEPLEFFLLFSSLAAFGLRGAADYAYAAAFQNAFACRRAQQEAAGIRAGRSLAIAWGPWSVDRYQPAGRDARMHEAGFALIGIEEAWAWLDQGRCPADGMIGAMLVRDRERVRADLGLAATPPATPAPAAQMTDEPLAERIRGWELRKRRGEPVSLHEVSEFIGADGLRGLSDSLIDRLHGLLINGGGAAAAAVGDEAPRAIAAADGPADLVAIVRHCLAEIVGAPEVEVNKPFVDYGLDSVSGARFALLLEKHLPLKIPPPWLLDHPTVRRLATHLAAMLAAAGQGPN